MGTCTEVKEQFKLHSSIGNEKKQLFPPNTHCATIMFGIKQAKSSNQVTYAEIYCLQRKQREKLICCYLIT